MVLFDKETREQFKDTEKEFHLEMLTDTSWKLIEIMPVRLEHSKKERQPRRAFIFKSDIS